ncbi:MAG: type II secretion system protein [Sedimentisphaerales bacterium]|nr:type II secretion system protein [Sedimentisphaerales bacterium]
MRTRNKAFTLVELLTVIGIISLLLSLALPALNEARMRAREVGDRASLHSIGVAIESFANDLGYYPPSNIRNEVISGFTLPTTLKRQWKDGDDPPDQGAHRLVEALFGLEYLGFQTEHYYYTENGIPMKLNTNTGRLEETKLWGPYLQIENVNLGTMQEAHANSTEFPDGSRNDNSVFVDTLDRKAPKAILYYRARASKRLHWPQSGEYYGYSIYNYDDNMEITQDENLSTNEPFHPMFADPTDIDDGFYKFIWNPITGIVPGGSSRETDLRESSARPFNKDTFMLINAGRDHEYGTADDICNFQKK